jgi:hypothetical protein
MSIRFSRQDVTSVLDFILSRYQIVRSRCCSRNHLCSKSRARLRGEGVSDGAATQVTSDFGCTAAGSGEVVFGRAATQVFFEGSRVSFGGWQSQLRGGGRSSWVLILMSSKSTSEAPVRLRRQQIGCWRAGAADRLRRQHDDFESSRSVVGERGK